MQKRVVNSHNPFVTIPRHKNRNYYLGYYLTAEVTALVVARAARDAQSAAAAGGAVLEKLLRL